MRSSKYTNTLQNDLFLQQFCKHTSRNVNCYRLITKCVGGGGRKNLPSPPVNIVLIGASRFPIEERLHPQRAPLTIRRRPYCDLEANQAPHRGCSQFCRAPRESFGCRSFVDHHLTSAPGEDRLDLAPQGREEIEEDEYITHFILVIGTAWARSIPICRHAFRETVIRSELRILRLGATNSECHDSSFHQG